MTVRDTTKARSTRKGAGSVETLLTTIVAGHTIAAAAKAAGMSEETAHRRLREPEVQEQLSKMRSDVITTAADRLAALCLGSVVALAEMARDPDVPWSVRYSAHKLVVDRAFSAHDVRILGERIERLEQALAAQQRLRALP